MIKNLFTKEISVQMVSLPNIGEGNKKTFRKERRRINSPFLLWILISKSNKEISEKEDLQPTCIMNMDIRPPVISNFMPITIPERKEFNQFKVNSNSRWYNCLSLFLSICHYKGMCE